MQIVNIHLNSLPVDILGVLTEFLTLKEGIALSRASKGMMHKVVGIKCREYSLLWAKVKEWGEKYFTGLKEGKAFLERLCDVRFEPNNEMLSVGRGSGLVLSWMNREEGIVLGGLREEGSRMARKLAKVTKKEEDWWGDLLNEKIGEFSPYAALEPFPYRARRRIFENAEDIWRENGPRRFFIPAKKQAALFIADLFYRLSREESEVLPVEDLLGESKKWTDIEEGIALAMCARLMTTNFPRALEMIKKMPNQEKALLELIAFIRQCPQSLKYEKDEQGKYMPCKFAYGIDLAARSAPVQLELIKVLIRIDVGEAIRWVQKIENPRTREEAAADILYHFHRVVRLEVMGKRNGWITQMLTLAEEIPDQLLKRRGLKTLLKYLKEVMEDRPERVDTITWFEPFDEMQPTLEKEERLRTLALTRLIQIRREFYGEVGSDEEIVELLTQFKTVQSCEIKEIGDLVTDFVSRLEREKSALVVFQYILPKLVNGFLMRYGGEYLGSRFLIKLLEGFENAQLPIKQSLPCFLEIVSAFERFYSGVETNSDRMIGCTDKESVQTLRRVALPFIEEERVDERIRKIETIILANERI